MKYAIYEGNLDRLEKKLKRIFNKCKAYQDGKSAFLINSLSVENKEYIFAKDSMEKDY